MEGKCTVQRGEEVLSPALLMPLHSGDEIHLTEKSRLVVVQDDNSEKSLGVADSPFIVPKTSEPPTWLGNLYKTLHTWLLTKVEGKHATVAMVSRGDDEPRFSGVSGENYILPRQTQLTLHWENGIAPYHLSLWDNKNTLLAERNSTGLRANLTLPELTDGIYRLSIQDADEQHHDIRLRIKPLPEDVQMIQDSNMPDAVKQRYIALLLAKKGAIWGLQAQQGVLGDDGLLGVVLRGEIPEIGHD
ncbi:hypothetical protein [Candidatus Venteria ishoeyi]|nr:hypothetical protein [Candidatus Venteria ishoeyi]